MTGFFKAFFLSAIICLSALSTPGCGGGSGGGDGGSSSSSGGGSTGGGSWEGTWNLTSAPAGTGIIAGTWTLSGSSSRTARTTYSSVKVLVWAEVTCTWIGSIAVDTDTYTDTTPGGGFSCSPPLAPVTETIVGTASYSFSNGGNTLTAVTMSEPWVWGKR